LALTPAYDLILRNSTLIFFLPDARTRAIGKEICHV